MSYGREWVLFLLWAPLVFAWYETRHTSRYLGLILKTLAFMAILLALAEPRWTLDETRVAVALLADTSASTSAEDLDRATSLARAISDQQGRHWLTVIPFSRSTRGLTTGEQTEPWHLEQTSGEEGRGTNLEAAVQDAIAALPAEMVPRLALISDGKENAGSLARAAWQAKELGIPIDTFALKGRSKPELRLESVSVPALAFTGERFPIDLLLSAPHAGPVDVELSAEGRMLGNSRVNLKAGENPVRLHTSLNVAGALELSIAVRSADAGEIRFDQAMVLRKPKLLYFSGDLPEQDVHLTAALAGAQFEITQASAAANLHLSDYQLVIFNNWDLRGIPEATKEDVAEYVRSGGGLLIVGGDRNIYIEEPEGVEDPLERALPAKIAPPRSPEGTAVVLIVDKSSSMEGRKMELARLASIGVVNNLRPIDTVGVLIFDNTFEWAVPLRRADNRNLINRLIAGITPDGGTQIAPALEESFNRIAPVQATYKHIVLLTDGISEEGNSLAISRAAEANKITISTVGLGQDVNRNYLEKVAELANGSSYFLTDLQQLEQILLKDVLEHTGSTTVERTLSPRVVKQVEILDGTGIANAPPLEGYVRFESKPTAETILMIDEEDPLLARWQYGLGRAAVFTSDAKSRWASEWVGWEGFDTFWTNLARDMLPHAQGGEATAEYDSANGDLVVSYRLGQGVPEPHEVPRIFVFGPDGFQKPIEVKKVAAGTFQGRLKIGSRQGLFRILPADESAAFPETGLYRPETELSDYGSNPDLLRQVAAFTGGRFEPEPDQVFAASGRSIPATMNLWPGLLAFAVLFSLIELVMRKWKGIAARA